MHGAHKSRNSPRGANHPQYKNGQESNEARQNRAKEAVAFRYLVDIGNHTGLFTEEVTLSGRPPREYEKLDLSDPEQLKKAIKRSH